VGDDIYEMNFVSQITEQHRPRETNITYNIYKKIVYFYAIDVGANM
jgi:hypothetical protein